MTSLTIQLPDDLADEAKRKGLLDPVQVTELIRQAVNNPKATEYQKTLLQQTSGIWQQGDGLQWQLVQREQWDREE
ncbi:MAG: hypothetical protein LKF82_04340 [Acinetobacter populi]|uniref:hypothetical protein n=1 Tax=Acinetobacter populi TaxID=1582270 RepID=UPI0023538031|nr:hypothetical protein [Acinetobacter populi]MCH4247057.1 hypothetical protein [Acinetobacter populi]